MNKPINQKQLNTILWLYKKLGYKQPNRKYLDKYSRTKASELIDKLKRKYNMSDQRPVDLGIMKAGAKTNTEKPKTILRKRL